MVYIHLPEPLKRRLVGMMHIFLDEKHIEGCGGLELTDEIRISIAAQACALLVGRAGRVFPHMRSVFVYPGAYVSGRLEWHNGLLAESHPRLGEAWHRGPVVLAWDVASRSLTGLQSVRNPVIHEFAHQLDDENGQMDGTPILVGQSGYAQ
jgi:Mlc titration factor MtfA (ptsG expression regulator)